VATPIFGDSALEAVDCIANKTMNSNAGVHLRLFMAHLTSRPFVPVPFRASHQDHVVQYLYVRPALTILREKSENVAFDCPVVYW
jgi:hypothetical protein